MNHRFQVIGVVVLAVLVGALVAVAVAPEPPLSSARSGYVPAVEDSRPSALFVGDSFAAGTGAPSRDDAHSCLTAVAMGWICNLDAQAGTGFIADGSNVDDTYERLIDRLPAVKKKYLADIVIIDAGRNDRRAPDERLRASITDYLDAVRAAWPKAQIVVIEPYFLNDPEPVLSSPVREHLAAETERVGGHLIDPFKEGWVLRDADSKDLDVESHRQIAQRLVAALRGLGLADLKVTDDRVDVS